MKKPNKEQMLRSLDDLQGIVNEMQEVNKGLQAVNATLVHEKNTLHGVTLSQDQKIKAQIEEINHLRRVLSEARGEAENMKALLFVEREKSWWTKLWE